MARDKVLRPASDAPPDLPGIDSHDLAPAARSAHAHLLATSRSMNLWAEPQVSAIRAVKLLDHQRRYLFSWILDRAHLLFYLRRPALKIMPSLAIQAHERLRGVSTNNAGEVTNRIETLRDAEALTDWLYARETWSGPDAPAELTQETGALPSHQPRP